MNSDERIRSLCERVVESKGAEFQAALLELQEALESRQDSENHDGAKSAKG